MSSVSPPPIPAALNSNPFSAAYCAFVALLQTDPWYVATVQNTCAYRSAGPDSIPPDNVMSGDEVFVEIFPVGAVVEAWKTGAGGKAGTAEVTQSYRIEMTSRMFTVSQVFGFEACLLRVVFQTVNGINRIQTVRNANIVSIQNGQSPQVDPRSESADTPWVSIAIVTLTQYVERPQIDAAGYGKDGYENDGGSIE